MTNDNKQKHALAPIGILYIIILAYYLILLFRALGAILFNVIFISAFLLIFKLLFC
jgi:hypothetical protein